MTTGLFLVTTVAAATSPHGYAVGLDSQISSSAHDQQVVMLRPSPIGRVYVPGGTFGMGSTLAEMGYAKQLCLHEPLGTVQLTVPSRSRPGAVESELLHCDPLRYFEAEGLLLPSGTYAPDRRRVTVSSFFMDRTEVRVADYARCVSAGACQPAGFASTDTRFARPDFPVVLVTWDDARQYCAFAKGRLPTEAEWELAARGFDERTFPWGNAWNPHLANHGSLALDREDSTDGFAGLAPVGSIPDGRTPLGLLDMAGNAAEWVADAVEPIAGVMAVPPYCPGQSDHMETYPHCCIAPQVWSSEHARCEGSFPKNKNGEIDCPPGTQPAGEPRTTCVATPRSSPLTNPLRTAGSLHVVRGGSYLDGAYMQRVASRTARYPSDRRADLGFRCASD